MDRNTVLAAFGEALCELPIGRHPALRIGSHEGYKSYRFGCATGRLLNIQALCHELAHAVDFGPDEFDVRAVPHGYGFRFRVHQIEVGGQLYDHPLTGQCTEREAEVVGIQLHIQEALGRKYRKDKVVWSHVRSFDFLPDWINFGGFSCDGSRNRRRYRRVSGIVTRAYEEWKKPEIFDRLEGWLDKTQERLRVEGEPTRGLPFSAIWPSQPALKQAA